MSQFDLTGHPTGNLTITDRSGRVTGETELRVYKDVYPEI